MTDEAITKCMENLPPDSDYDGEYYAALAREKSDWIIGMNLSRLYGIMDSYPHRIGRVKTPVLSIIVQRDNEIASFEKKVTYRLEMDNGAVSVEEFSTFDEAENARKMCEGKTANVQSAVSEEKKKNRPLLHSLTTLQQEANRVYGFTAKQTLEAAQSLYERKLTTYPRTDCNYVSEDMRGKMISIVSTLGDRSEYADRAHKLLGVGLNLDERIINNSKMSGHDHYAIIPEASTAALDGLSDTEQKIYGLIVNRLLCALDMENNSALSYAGQYEKICNIMMRYAILAKTYGAAVPADIEVKQLSKEGRSIYGKEKHTPVVDRLLFLYGAGALDDNALQKLVINIKANFIDDVAAAENKLIAEMKKNEEDRMPYSFVQNILICAATSKKYPEMKNLSFDDAEKICSLNHIKVIDGFVKIDDRDYYKFLIDLGEDFGLLGGDGKIFTGESADNLLGNEEVQKGELVSGNYPFVLAPVRLIYYAKVCDKLYGRDFIKYAKEKKIPFDDNYEAEYESYVRKIKLHFEVRCYKRIRNICGSRINWFDYAASADGVITDNLSQNRNIKPIDLDVKENYSDDELLKKAVKKYCLNLIAEEDTVIEVFHDSKAYLFTVKSEEIIPISSTKFHNQLFDFNKIWSIIQMCSRNRQIMKMNDRIVIPEEIWNEIEPEQREYADRLIKEQYKRMMEHRKSNKLLQSLSDLKAAAAEAQRKKQSQLQEHTQSVQNRGKPTEE